MVNFFTTLAGILTGLIYLIITLLTLALFAIWLQTRDLFYLVGVLFQVSSLKYQEIPLPDRDLQSI